jgi:hypothetical protein
MCILAILAIITIGQVSAYNPTYKVNDNSLTINLNLSANSPNDYKNTLNLGGGKKVHISISKTDSYIKPGYRQELLMGQFITYPPVTVPGKVYVKIDTENTPDIAHGSLSGTKNTNEHTSISYKTFKKNQLIFNKTDVLYPLKLNSINIDFKSSIGGSNSKLADLTVTKVTKKDSYHYVTIKNVGKKSAGKNHLGIYVGKKNIKTLNVKSLGAGKHTTVKVLIPKKNRNVMKTFQVDINNVVKESNERNNALKSR